MNREQKRMLQRQGELGKDGAPIAPTRQVARPSASARKGPRTSPLAFLREVRSELRKVNWPTRNELKTYSAVVLITLILMIAYITLLDQVFQKAALFLFK